MISDYLFKSILFAVVLFVNIAVRHVYLYICICLYSDE